MACVKSGIAFVGIEREPTYFDVACRRIEAAFRQPDMFISPAGNDNSHPKTDLFSMNAA